uniref:C6 domain-containing protein n=1 Tax=Globodera rostochiensis TaxID=31243 RepID=A0A914HHK9_GLORO
MRSCQWFAIICVLLLPGKLQCCYPPTSDTRSAAGTSGTGSASSAAAAAPAAPAAPAPAAAAGTGSCTSCTPSSLRLITAPEVFPLTNRPPTFPGFDSATDTVTTNGVVRTNPAGCLELPLSCPDPLRQPVLIRIIIRQPVSDPVNYDAEIKDSGQFTLLCNSEGVWTATNTRNLANNFRAVDEYACLISPPRGR